MIKVFQKNDLIGVAQELIATILENNGHIVGLSGDLGAGKTTLMQNAAKLLGVENNVVSPTFVLRRDYNLTPSPSPMERGTMQRIRTSVLENYDDLKIKASRMRKKPTVAEKFLWKFLRGREFSIRFRRQHIVNNFIVDFINLENKIIIEVDGEVHENQKERDEERTKIFEDLGFKVLRFKNEEVLNGINVVLEKVKLILNSTAPFSNGEGLGIRLKALNFKKLIHIDAYRLERPEMLSQVLTKEELEDKNNLIAIEWPEMVDNNIFNLIFKLEHISEEERKIELIYTSPSLSL